LSYVIFPGLEISTNFGYTDDNLNNNQIFPSTSFNPPLNALPFVRANRTAVTSFNTWMMEPKITYKAKFERSTLEALIGTTFQQNRNNSNYILGSNFSSDALIDNLSAATTFSGGNYLATIYHYNAIYGRVNYNFDDKYLINITARRDGSSRFGPGRQFGNFGAIGAGWIFSKEKIVSDNLSFLSFGKLRGSYGITGNDQTGDYQFLSTYSSSFQNYQGITGLLPTLPANPNFGWETVKKLEVAIELGLLKDRLFLEVSLFRNRSGNQLVGFPLPTISGFSSVPGYNLPAVVQNSGVELSINTINIESKNFNWTSHFNLSIPRNKLVSFPGLATNGSYNTTYVVGQPLSIQYMTHYTGLNPNTGLYTFRTANTDGMPSYPADYYFTPAITQKYYGGFQNNFNYKGLGLDFFVQFVKQTGRNYLTAFGIPPGAFGGGLGNQPIAVLQRWQNPGDASSIEKFTTNPGSIAYSAYSNYKSSDANISDASFIRLQNLTFSYQIFDNWQKALHIKNAEIFIRGQNLFTITKYKGWDPESQGISIPPLRMITLGLSATF
jgi:hypothetical protein